MKKLSDVLNISMPAGFSSHLRVSKIWTDCAGDTISFLTTAGALKDGVLNISVHDRTWLSEIGFLKGELISRLNEKGLEVSNINFFYKPKPLTHLKNIPRRKEMSAKEKTFADRLVDTIPDEVLRESFRKAIYGYFTRYTLDDYLNS
jgi:hypothetical protein